MTIRKPEHFPFRRGERQAGDGLKDAGGHGWLSAKAAVASDGGLKRYHLLSRLASIGIIAVLAIMIGVAVSTASTTEKLIRRASEPVRLSALYAEARYHAGDEESLEREYRLEPSPLLIRQQEMSGERLTACLATIREMGDPIDRQKADDLIARQAVYENACKRMFAAIAAHNVAEANEIDRSVGDPAIDHIRTVIGDEARSDHEEAIAGMADLSRVERRMSRNTVIVFVIGLALDILFIFVLRAYRRRLNAGIKGEIARLERAGRTDHLTGLGNHRAFQEAFLDTAAQSGSGRTSAALVLLDMDEFKAINDLLGHAHGDQVLRDLAGILQSNPDQRWYRLGGDKFGLLQPSASIHDALTAMERLRERAHTQLSATISIGVATSNPDGSDLDTLRERAYAALYEAKRRGRNLVVSADDVIESSVIITPAKEHSMRRLLSTQRMTIAFQPIWNAATGSVFAFEALARPDAEYGFQGPQEAFDIAERMGHAHDLDRICRRAVLARAHELPTDALLFINMSPQSLGHADLSGAELVKEVLAAGIEPRRIVIELTERSMGRLSVVVREVRRLQSMGFRLALDDTGAGNAGLEMLGQISVDVIKIDRAVVVGAMTDKSARGVLAGIIAIARETETDIVAEGIETPEMLDMLARFWADGPSRISDAAGPARAVQGYLLGRPSASLPTPADLRAGRSILDKACRDTTGLQALRLSA